MDLKEKIIKGFECCKDMHTAGPGYAQGCIACPYADTKNDGMNGFSCVRKLYSDVIRLLSMGIVHCKDCKYFVRDRLKSDYTEDKRFKRSVCVVDRYSKHRNPEWYCADGIRRSENE